MSLSPALALEPNLTATRFERRALAGSQTSAAPAGCPICESGGRHTLTSLVDGAGEAVLVREVCRNCGHASFARMPSPEWFEAFYRDEFESAEPAPTAPPELDYSPVSDLLLPHLDGRDGTLLDVGCGYGSALAHFRRLGFRKLVGLEISERRAGVAEAAGFPIARRTAEALGTDPVIAAHAPFDAVYSWHAFEHVVDPIPALHGIARVLKPGGILVVCVPHAEAEHSLQAAHYVPHIHGWRPESLRWAFRRVGVEPIAGDDGLRLVGRKLSAGQLDPPDPGAEGWIERLAAARFAREYAGVPEGDGWSEALIRFSDYRGGDSFHESTGRVEPLAQLTLRPRIATTLALRTPAGGVGRFRELVRAGIAGEGPAMLARVSSPLAADGEGPGTLEVRYGRGAEAWVK